MSSVSTSVTLTSKTNEPETVSATMLTVFGKFVNDGSVSKINYFDYISKMKDLVTIFIITKQ
jgi:hypothetical protein